MFQFMAFTLRAKPLRVAAHGGVDLASFTAADGAAIQYDDEGRGRPLVMLHGLMAHRGFFKAQDALAEDFRLIRIDLRGHGESRTRDGLDIATLAGDVAALVGELDLRDAIGIGWSLGATVLWEVLAGPASSHFAGAVIVDMTPKVRNDGGWSLGLSDAACTARGQAITDDFEGFARGAGEAIFATPEGATHPDRDWSGDQFARNDPAAIAALWQSLAQQDSRVALSRIRQPTLIVHGARSHLYGPETADHLGEAIPSSRIVPFEASGHSPHLEQPDLFNATIRDFAASLPAAAPDRHVL